MYMLLSSIVVALIADVVGDHCCYLTLSFGCVVVVVVDCCLLLLVLVLIVVITCHGCLFIVLLLLGFVVRAS